MNFKHLIFSIFQLFGFFCYSQTDESILNGQQKLRNSLNVIQRLRVLSNDNDKTPEERIALADRAYKLSNESKIDTTILLSSRNLAYQYMIFSEFENHRKISYHNLNLSKKLKDTLALAYTRDNLGYNYFINRELDSAYYYYSFALKDYESLKIVKNRIRVLIDLASIFKDEKDYVGSDEFLIEALSLANSLEKSQIVLDYKRHVYDLFARNSLAQDDFDQAIKYHELAIETADQLPYGNLYKMWSYNNLAWVYRRKENFDKALELYNIILEDDEIFEDDPASYPLVLENIAYTRYLRGDKDKDSIERTFQKAIALSKEFEDKSVELSVAVDMAKFYLNEQKTDSTLKYGKLGYKIGREITENEILLDVLMVLSKVEDEKDSKMYLNEYIQLNDSILKKERSARNKYARIKFQTDEIEKENAMIEEQRKWLVLFSLGLILTSILVYIIYTQRSKNKELQFAQDQQKSNEEIYNLLLTQQDKVDEARANEKKRISQEIHDGILGRMFGVRLSLDSLNFNSGPDAIKNRSHYISELKTIEDDMRKVSHDLNTDFVSGSGFIGILEELIQKQTLAYNLKYNFDFRDDISWEYVPNKVKINIYRIIQEVLQNIYKHAGAEKVWISILLNNDVICLNLRDDGKGFDTAKGKKGIGLKNITSRTKEIDGKINIQSTIHEGTSVEIRVPYKS
ncbi:Histidine kinase [Flavobacteriaceae bacterium MAR_2010_188]|nr:Histidine kinase [Flavobacteriaceae bacterium MAR_2010_188]